MITQLKNIKQLATLKKCHEKDGRRLRPGDLSIIENAELIYDQNKILYSGPMGANLTNVSIDRSFDCSDFVITPEIIDTHTHLIFAGNRSTEYKMRLDGAGYEEIAKAGGGILNSAKQSEQESDDELFSKACQRVERIYSYGISTIEIKSGYGLSYEQEKRMTLLIDRVKKKYHPKIQIFNTFLAAHAVPREFNNSNEYLEKVCLPLLDELAPLGIIDFVDIFHEQGYFETEDVKKLFDCAKKHGMKLKIHADEFNDNKGAILACDYEAISCDHLLATTKDGIKALSNSKTIATLLPGTGLFLGKPCADARTLLDHGAKVSIASDFNPGSCHCDNLILLSSIAAPMYKMNFSEIWCSITYNAASALDLTDQGALIEGFRPRMSFFKVNTLEEVNYNWGKNLSVWPEFL